MGMCISGAAAAQEREVQTHRAGEPEGRLLAYYAATMVYSPLATTTGAWRWSAGVEATYLPRLSEAQRRPGIDKPEATNLSPVLPRPRLALRTPVALVELSWVPPLRVADAEANLLAGALSREIARWRGVAVAPRLSIVTGSVRGAITCNPEMVDGRGRDLAVYFATICHGTRSDDRFEPRLIAGELVASRPLARRGAAVTFAAGARRDRSRFDIGVMRRDGTRDLDHPVLELRDTRMHVAAGVRWPIAGRVVSGGEWFYAPGSVSTLRLLLSVTGGR